jgi:hypothetical protein
MIRRAIVDDDNAITAPRGIGDDAGNDCRFIKGRYDQPN